MNIISLVKDDALFERACLENIPFYKWSTWIEQTLNKEVLSQLFGDNNGVAPKKKASGKTTAPAEKSKFKLDLISFMKRFTSKGKK